MEPGGGGEVVGQQVVNVTKVYFLQFSVSM